MRNLNTSLMALGIVLALALFGCADSESGEHRSRAESGEHSGESQSEERGEGEESREGDEESATQYALDQTFDQVRNGARLILSYDSNANAFSGTVENTTAATLNAVRVEVHLSNGVELGPTTPLDLAPGQTHGIALPASDESFESWSAHPEVG